LCFSVAGFVRIRCGSLKTIQILTNPATFKSDDAAYKSKGADRVA
jgi:hypothetical protein